VSSTPKPASSRSHCCRRVNEYIDEKLADGGTKTGDKLRFGVG